MREKTQSSWLQYAVAVLAMILAAALRRLLDPLLGDLFPFAILLFAVLVAAWYGGFGSAVTATVVGAIAAFVFLLPPRNELTIEGIENQAGLVLYLLAGFGISVLGGSMQTARRRTEGHLKQLEHEVRQRREAERELQKSQQHLQQQREELRTTLLSIGDAVITTDPQGRVTFLNPVAEKLTGWTQADADGVPLSHVFQIVNEHTRQPVENPVEKALQSGRIVGLANHTNLIAKDGTECSIEDSAAPIRSENGEIFGCVLVFRDVTERRLLERERQQFVRLAETSSEFIGMCDTKQVPFFVNQAGLELVGLESLEQAKQTPVGEFFFPEDREMIENEFLPEVLKEGQGEVEVRFRHFQTGEPLWMIYNVSVLRDEKNEPVGFATVSRNITDRKQAVAALQESEALLRFILDSTEIGQWDLDLTTDTAKRTLRHDQIFGYETLLPKWSYETFLNQHVHPDDRDLVDSRFHEAAQNGTGWDVECRIHRTDGALRWISVTSSIYMTRNGQPTRMAGLVTDITERKNAEIRERKLLEEAAAANAKFHAFFDQGPLFAGIMALDGMLIEANRLSLEACGYTSGQVLGKLFWDCPWWNPSSQLKQQIKKACEQASTGEAYRAEMPYFVADGSQRMVDFIILPIKDETGRVLFLAPTGTDITERKQAVNSILQRSQQLRRLADVASRVNLAVEVASVLGVITEEARGLIGAHQSVTSLTRGPKWDQAINAVSLSDKYQQWKDYESPPDGSGIYSLVCQTNQPMRLTQEQLESHPAWKGFGNEAENHPPVRGWLAVPLVGRGGRNIGLIQVSDKVEGDFTEDDESLLVQLAQMASSAIENAQLVENLREADRRKDDFLAMLAHELRNPLAPIRSGLDILALESDGPNEIVALMQDQVEHVIRLVDDLLDVSRIMRDKVELRKQPVELAPLIKRSVDAIRNVIDSYQHELMISLPDRPIWLNADQVRIVQILENLLTNASKYMDAGGTINLTVECQNKLVSIRIEDTGIGIEPELLPNIFQLFTQSSRSLDRSQGGLGIGLTLVQRLVHMHGGSVSAASEGLGCGSTFTIQLPEIDPPQTVQETTPKVQVTERRRIVVVDDNRSASYLLTKLLEMVGDHEVMTAHDGPTALATITENHPEIVLLDIGLPGMNGYEVGRKVRENSKLKDVLLVALTGYGQEEDYRKSKEAGFDEHLVKPPSIEQVKTLLTHPKLKRIES